jgi:hypothetical protein
MKFAAFKAYVSVNGRHPAQNEVVEGINIGKWANMQRLSESRLAVEQVQALDSVPGWSWASKNDAEWNTKFAQLKAYVDEHMRLPSWYETIGDFEVGKWIGIQRRRGRANKIAPEQGQALEQLPGWRWSHCRRKDDDWQRKFGMLQAFIAEHGCLPSQKSVIRGIHIGRWANTQRKLKKGQALCKLTPERIQSLESLPGWSWKYNIDVKWNENYAKYKAYVARYGRFPTRSARFGNFRVGDWAHRNREILQGPGQPPERPETPVTCQDLLSYTSSYFGFAE